MLSCAACRENQNKQATTGIGEQPSLRNPDESGQLLSVYKIVLSFKFTNIGSKYRSYVLINYLLVITQIYSAKLFQVMLHLSTSY